MHAKEVMAAFLSALVSANQESFAIEKLELCLASPGFRTACSDGLLDHCHVTDPKGNVSRPLELAARRGYTSVVSELLAQGASPALHSQAVTGNTPLHMAVLHGDAKMTSQMVAALQENGGNVDIPNSNGDTALMFAMHRAAQDMHASTGPIVHLLSAGSSVATRNHSGLSALMIACTSSSGSLWKLLVRLTQKSTIIQALEDCDVHGNTPLHLAARAGSTSVGESLLSYGASPFSLNKASESPLDVARISGHTATTTTLRRARRDAIEAAEEAAAQLIQEALAERNAAKAEMEQFGMLEQQQHARGDLQAVSKQDEPDDRDAAAHAALMHVNNRPPNPAGPSSDPDPRSHARGSSAVAAAAAAAAPQSGSSLPQPLTSSPSSTMTPTNSSAHPHGAILKNRKHSLLCRPVSGPAPVHKGPHHSTIAKFFKTGNDTQPNSNSTYPNGATTETQSHANVPSCSELCTEDWQPFNTAAPNSTATHVTSCAGPTSYGQSGLYTHSDTVITVPMDPRDGSMLSSYAPTGEFDTPSMIESTTSAVYRSETLSVPIDPSGLSARYGVHLMDRPCTVSDDGTGVPRRSFRDAAYACEGGEGVMASVVEGDTTYNTTYDTTFEESDYESICDTRDYMQHRMHVRNASQPPVVVLARSPGHLREEVPKLPLQGVAAPVATSPMTAAAAAAAVTVAATAATGSPMTHHSGSTRGSNSGGDCNPRGSAGGSNSGGRLQSVFRSSQDLAAATAAAVAAAAATGNSPMHCGAGSGSGGFPGPPSEAGSVASSAADTVPVATLRAAAVVDTDSAVEVEVSGAQYSELYGLSEGNPTDGDGAACAHNPNGNASLDQVLLRSEQSSVGMEGVGRFMGVNVTARRARYEGVISASSEGSGRPEKVVPNYHPGSSSSGAGVTMTDAIGISTVAQRGGATTQSVGARGGGGGGLGDMDVSWEITDGSPGVPVGGSGGGYLLQPTYTGVDSLMLEGPGPQACSSRQSMHDTHAYVPEQIKAGPSNSKDNGATVKSTMHGGGGGVGGTSVARCDEANTCDTEADTVATSDTRESSARHTFSSASNHKAATNKASRVRSVQSAKRVAAVLGKKLAGKEKEVKGLKSGRIEAECSSPRLERTRDRLMRAAEKLPSSAASAKRESAKPQLSGAATSKCKGSPAAAGRSSAGPGSGSSGLSATAAGATGGGAARPARGGAAGAQSGSPRLAAAYGAVSEAALAAAAAAAAAAAGLAESPAGRESPYAYRLNSSALLMSSLGGNTASTLPGLPPPPCADVRASCADVFTHLMPSSPCNVDTPTPLTPHTPTSGPTPSTPDKHESTQPAPLSNSLLISSSAPPATHISTSTKAESAPEDTHEFFATPVNGESDPIATTPQHAAQTAAAPPTPPDTFRSTHARHARPTSTGSTTKLLQQSFDPFATDSTNLGPMHGTPFSTYVTGDAVSEAHTRTTVDTAFATHNSVSAALTAHRASDLYQSASFKSSHQASTADQSEVQQQQKPMHCESPAEGNSLPCVQSTLAQGSVSDARMHEAHASAAICQDDAKQQASRTACTADAHACTVHGTEAAEKLRQQLNALNMVVPPQSQHAERAEHGDTSLPEEVQQLPAQQQSARVLQREVSFRDAAFSSAQQSQHDQHDQHAFENQGVQPNLEHEGRMHDNDDLIFHHGKRNRGAMQNGLQGVVGGCRGVPFPQRRSSATNNSATATGTTCGTGTRATTATNSSTSRDASGSFMKVSSTLDLGKSDPAEPKPPQPQATHASTHVSSHTNNSSGFDITLSASDAGVHPQIAAAVVHENVLAHGEFGEFRGAPRYAQLYKTGVYRSQSEIKTYPVQDQISGLDLSPSHQSFFQSNSAAAIHRTGQKPSSARTSTAAPGACGVFFDSSTTHGAHATDHAGLPLLPLSRGGSFIEGGFNGTHNPFRAANHTGDSLSGGVTGGWGDKYRVPPSPLSEGSSPYAAGHVARNAWGGLGDHHQALHERRGSYDRATVDLNNIWDEKSPRVSPRGGSGGGPSGPLGLHNEDGHRWQPAADPALMSTPAATIATEFNVELPCFLGADPSALTMVQLEAMEDFHYQQLEKISRAKLGKHRELRQRQVQELRQSAEVLGDFGHQGNGSIPSGDFEISI